MKVRTTTRRTIVTAEGYISRSTTTVTTFSDAEATDDPRTHQNAVGAGSVGVGSTDAGPADARPMGMGSVAGGSSQVQRGVGRPADQEGAPAMAEMGEGCFDMSGCDDLERRLIALMRAYLRPACAPEPLMARLHACLDRAEDEECRGCGCEGDDRPIGAETVTG